MKIDKAFIDSVALQLVGNMDIWGLCDDEDNNMEQLRLLTLGYVSGVSEMAHKLKMEMEKSDDTD